MTELITETRADATSLGPTFGSLRQSTRCWVVILAVGAIDVIWLRGSEIALAGKPFARLLLLVAYFSGVSWLFTKGRPTYVKSAAARVCAGAAQVLGLLMVVAPFSYLIDSLRMPLVDRPLRAVDAALGFSWEDYTQFILRHRGITSILAYAYSSIEIQILVILTICCADAIPREIEFLQNYALTMIICVVIGGLLPALGEPSPFQILVHTEFARVRTGHWHVLDYSTAQGIVAFPSFHTAFAVVALYSVRHCAPALLGMVVVNLLLIVSVPTFGGHYLSDMIGGAGVAVVSIMATKRLRRPEQTAERGPGCAFG